MTKPRLLNVFAGCRTSASRAASQKLPPRPVSGPSQPSRSAAVRTRSDRAAAAVVTTSGRVDERAGTTQAPLGSEGRATVAIDRGDLVPKTWPGAFTLTIVAQSRLGVFESLSVGASSVIDRRSGVPGEVWCGSRVALAR
jgi:hypothetical protein